MLETIDTNRFAGERVGVIYGGRSPERPVSLETGEALAEALRGGDYEVEEYDFPADRGEFESAPPAVALLALHGGAGEDGTIQGYLETLGVPYTGSGVLGSALAIDKRRSKALFKDAGLMTPDSVSLAAGEAEELEDVTKWFRSHGLEPPVVVKPADGGSSQGVKICESADEAVDAVTTLIAELEPTATSGIVVEEYIDGSEYTVGLFDDECLGALEVVPGEEFYDYEAKYESDETEYRILEKPSLTQRLETAGRLAYDALGCSGVARADFVARRDRGDQVLYALEVNTIPGMTESSLVPKLASHRGISFERFTELMVSSASLETEGGAA